MCKLRQVLILRSDGAANPANYTVSLYDTLPVLGDNITYQIRLEEVVLQATVGENLPDIPMEIRLSLGTPTLVWDSRSRGPSTTIGFYQEFQTQLHPWITCASGQPFNQIGVSMHTLDGALVPNLAYAVISVTLKALDD